MTREEFDNLLKELTDENLTTDRQLEIFDSLQKDKQAHLDNEVKYVENTDKLQNEVLALKKQKVDDFFNKGVSGNPPKDNEPTIDKDPSENEILSYDEIVANMIGVEK